MNNNKKWFSFGRILHEPKRDQYWTDITSDGNMSDWQDDDKFLMEDVFDTLEDAKNDLLNQGYMYDSEIQMYVYVGEYDDMEVVSLNPWENMQINKKLEPIFKCS